MTIARELGLALLSTAIAAQACSCGSYPTTCASLAAAKVAFIGTVTQGTESEDATPPRGFGNREAVLTVETIVRGLMDGTREIRVNPMIMTSCYFPLKIGQRLLIVGGTNDREPNVVHTGVCSGSREILDGDAEIERMVATHLGGPSLFFGTVRLYKDWDSRWRKDNLVPGAEVKLTGAKDWSTRTGESGRFEVEGLPAGEYQLAVTKSGLSAELSADSPFRDGEEPGKFVMPERGCVEAPVLLFPDTSISGTVRGVDGGPIAGIKVVALRIEDGGRARSARGVKTGKDGRYVIPRLLAGTYAVGINAERGSDSEYPTTYHPSSPTQQGAMQVTVGADKSADGIDILVLPKRNAVTVRVRVVWPDKQPVERAIVRAEHPETGIVYSTDFRSGFTNKDGFATIQLFEGTEYTLSSTWQKMETTPENRIGRTVAWHHTNRPKFVAAPEATVTLTMSETPEPHPFR